MVHCALQKFPFTRPRILTQSSNLRSQNTRLHKPITVVWYRPGPDIRTPMPEPSDQVCIFPTQNHSTALNSSIPPDAYRFLVIGSRSSPGSRPEKNRELCHKHLDICVLDILQQI